MAITLNGTTGIDTPAIDSDTFPTLAGQSVATGFRNKIIGGDFTTNPWQRGTSFTALANSSYGADRFSARWASTSAVVDWLKTADAPTAAQAGVFTQHCLHLDVTTADASIAAGDIYAIDHRVEGLNAAAFGFGQTGTRYITLSFWHKHTKTGTYCVGFKNSANDRAYIAEYTQDITDTWEKATITIPVDTTGTWLYDIGVGLRIVWVLAGGSTFQTTAGAWQAGNFQCTSNQVNALDSTSNNFKIALVQLEAGSVATPFESRPVGTELALCQRYYENSYTAGVTSTTGQIYAHAYSTARPAGFSYQFLVPKRVTPTSVTLYSPVTGTAARVRNDSTSADVTTSTVAAIGRNTYIWDVASGMSAGNQIVWHYEASAEL